jgi:hypothetical protein
MSREKPKRKKNKQNSTDKHPIGGGKLSDKPEHIRVDGKIETTIHPDLVKKYDAGQDKQDSREETKLRVEIVTLIFLFVYTSVALWQGCSNHKAAIAAKDSADAAKTSADTGRQELELSKHPWVGLDNAAGGLNLKSIVIDSNLTANVVGLPAVKNFGNYPAQNVDVMAALVLFGSHDSSTSLEEKQDTVCSAYIDPRIGDLIFPNTTHLPTEIVPAGPYQIPLSERGDTFHAFVVGCVIYKDQFGNVYQTGFEYLLLNPGKPGTPTAMATFPASPNISVSGYWQLRYTSIWKPKEKR